MSTEEFQSIVEEDFSKYQKFISVNDLVLRDDWNGRPKIVERSGFTFLKTHPYYIQKSNLYGRLYRFDVLQDESICLPELKQIWMRDSYACYFFETDVFENTCNCIQKCLKEKSTCRFPIQRHTEHICFSQQPCMISIREIKNQSIPKTIESITTECCSSFVGYAIINHKDQHRIFRIDHITSEEDILEKDDEALKSTFHALLGNSESLLNGDVRVIIGIDKDGNYEIIV